MNRIILTLITLIAISSTADAQQDKRLKGLEKEIEALLAVTEAPGCAVAIVQGDKILFSKGFGYSDYENKVPVDANTLFAIGSTSKAFTTSILGQLREEGKLTFDDKPSKYIPEFKFYNDEMNRTINITDMISHRTGLPRHDYSWYLFPTWDKDSLLARVEFHEPFTGIREHWYYNNYMYLAQGVIAERITGKSWEENIKERFFTPLGMSRSNASISEMKNSSNKAFGYELTNDGEISKMDYYDIAAMSPAGSINSSANDMSNWLITWVNKGNFKGEQILSESYISEAISSQMIIGGALPDKDFPDLHFSNYGYAWMLSSYKGHYRAEHGGNIDGFSANVALYPSDSLGIVVLVNQNGSGLPSLIRNCIADRMLETEKTDWLKRITNEKLEQKKAMEELEAASESTTAAKSTTKPSHFLNDYAGDYAHPGYGKFTITNQNDSLFANFKIEKWFLKHVHYDVFEPFTVTKSGIDTTEASGLRLNFETNTAGDISAVKMKIEGTLDDPIKFKHTPALLEIAEGTLEKYVGEYELAGTDLKVYVKNGNVLYLFVSGQPEYELVATGENEFSLKIVDGYKVQFLESEDKTINELIMIQPNGRFKASKK